MNLHQLRVFCAVAENQSFSAASEKLHLTQPAVTLQIKNLEEYYQLRFFERAGKKVFLTDEGKVLLEIATRMLDLDRQAEEVIADLKGLSRGTVRIGTSFSFAYEYLPYLLRAFHEKYPKIFIQVSTGNTSQIIDDTLLHKNDVAFVAYHPRNARLVVRECVSDTLVAAVPNQHKLANRELITLNELNGEPLLLREPGSSYRGMVDETFKKKGITPLIFMESASTAAIMGMVKSGAGIGILSEQAVRRDVESGAFKAKRFTEVEMNETFYLIYHREKYSSRALKAFIQTTLNLDLKGSAGSANGLY